MYIVSIGWPRTQQNSVYGSQVILNKFLICSYNDLLHNDNVLYSHIVNRDTILSNTFAGSTSI